MDNILTIFNGDVKLPETYLTDIAQREKALRKKMKLSRKELSEKSNVSYGSLKRFEETGNISLTSLVKLAIALDSAADFDSIFRTKKPTRIEEIIDGED